MSFAVHTDPRPGFLTRLADWWRGRNGSCRTVAELERRHRAEMKRVAHDGGLAGDELRVLAGKWPDSGGLLLQRMGELELEAKEFTRAESLVMRNLQRVCTICGNQQRCEHDLAQSPSDHSWREYCPNALTFQALMVERAGGKNMGPK